MERFGSAPNDTNARLPPVPPPRAPRRETHRALYDFTGQNENEVNLKTGQHVLVTQGDTNGWSLVKMEAGVGWAPSRYLTELEPEPPPAAPFPTPSSTTSLGMPPPPPLPRCDPCKKDEAECKRTSAICDRCKEQGQLCTDSTPRPPPPTCQGYGRSARILSVNEDHEKPQTCVACGVRGMAPDEDFCSRCKSNGIKLPQRLPTSCYIPETVPPLGSQQYNAMKAATAVRACHTCYFAKIKCDEGKPGCSNCKERNVSCKYSTLLDFAKPAPQVNAEGESSKAASVSSNSNAMPLRALSPLSKPRRSTKRRSGCITCKHRRIQCDEMRPNCQRCTRDGRDCVYEESTQPPSLITQALPLRPLDLLASAAAARSTDLEPQVQSFGDSNTARGPKDIMRERQAKYAKGAEQEAKAAMEPPAHFNELHLICGPCRKAGAHCIGFPSHTCKRCNDNNIECEITLRPAITDQYRESDPPTKSGHACSNCQRFQLYCDKAMPNCSYCEPRKLRCTYRADTQRGSNVVSPGTERESLDSTLPRYRRADGMTSDPVLFNNRGFGYHEADGTTTIVNPALFNNEHADAKSQGLVCEDYKANGDVYDTDALDMPDPQRPKEHDGDGDEWEMIDEPDLEEEIDAVLVEREPQLNKSHGGKQKSETDAQFEKVAKKIRSDLDAWSHAADRPKLARWSAKDGDTTYEGYIVDGVVLKSDEVDPEIVKNQPRLACHVGQQKPESNLGDEKTEKETDSIPPLLSPAAIPGAGRLHLLARYTIDDTRARYGCEAEGYVIDRVVRKNEKVDPVIVAHRARLDRMK